MIPKLNQSVLEKLEFTKLLHESYENEAPKITFVQNRNEEYKFKLHFLELIYESNLWHKTFAKGVKALLEEATPLLKMCLTKDNFTKTIEKISFEKLNSLLDMPEEAHRLINTITPFDENINNFPNTEVSSQVNNNNSIRFTSESLVTDTNNNLDPIDYNSVIKQKFDFTGNFVNFDISQSDEDETPTIDLFSHAQKKVKVEPLNSIEILNEVSTPATNELIPCENAENTDTEIYDSKVSEPIGITEEITPAINKINEATNNESLRVYKKKFANVMENIKDVTTENKHPEGVGVYEMKLKNFIKENSLPMFSKQFKGLKKLHKCIVTFIDDSYESKFNLSPQKAEDDVFKQICDDYEL